MDDVHQTIQTLLIRYQRRLMLHLLLLGAVGASCVVVLLWRLTQWGTPLWLRAAVALAAFAALAAWQWRLARRTQFSRSGILLGLDRALGLDARLVTAAQFATAPQPPLLYARLAHDPALSPSELSKRLPRVADRRALLFGLLLLLILWPWHRAPLAQLAMQTPAVTLPMPATDAGTPEGGRGGSPDGAAGGAPQSQPQSQGDQQQPSGGSGSASQGAGGEQRDQSSSSQGSQGQDQRASSQSQQAQGQGQQSEQSPQQDGSPREAQSSGQQQSAASKQQQAESSQASSAQSGQRPEDAGGQSGSRQEAGAQQQPGAQRAEQGGRQGGAAGAQTASANQEALKADIQQMLQELSTELKQLEAQLQPTQHNQPNPAAGTSTDPNLYEQASPLERTSGRALPIQLDVDQQATSSARKGGGVGRPSGQAADATPQQQAEEVALADQASEESGGRRQAIPPEYRPVFERLSTSGGTTSTQ